MILKEIQVRNIRSYVELPTFEFPEGTSLFYGGVGSGKSSLLYAIEFALFGLGELKGRTIVIRTVPAHEYSHAAGEGVFPIW